MLRVLVVEDQTDFYEDDMLRVFRSLLPMEKVSITHVPTLDAALAALQEPWEVILMDYSLGPKTAFLGDPVRDGGDLVSFRRAVELQRGLGHSIVIGTSSNQVGNELLIEKGANGTLLKLQLVEMAHVIKEAIQKAGKV